MKNEVNAILVDDEIKASSMLELKLNKFFPQISIIGKYNDPVKAIEEVNALSPQLLFLDINMPGYTGFEFLQHIERPSFELIFVTAYDHYALEAIKHAAIGYVLKPVNDDDLKTATLNSLNNIYMKYRLADTPKTKISIPFPNGFIVKSPDEIIRCEGYDGNTKIFLVNNEVVVSSYNIGLFNKLLTPHYFRMVHKSHLVNLNHVVKYFNEGTIVLSNKDQVPVSRSHKNKLLQHFKYKF